MISDELWRERKIELISIIGLLQKCQYSFKWNSPFNPVRLLVALLVGPSVCHNFQKGREVTLPFSYRGTCYLLKGFFSIS